MKYLLVFLLLCFAPMVRAEGTDSAFIAKGSGYGQGLEVQGFWEYTYPLFTPSGDTFIVTMQDSFWMTGERPKTETLWYGWERWGTWWYLRPEPEIKKGEGNWYMQFRSDALDPTIRIRLDTLWQVAESIWIEKDQGEWLYPEFHIKEE